MTEYAGIDYGLGQSNVDKATGIRYGVISQNSINLDCADSWKYDYGKPHCPKCGNEIKASDDPDLFSLDCMCAGDVHTEGCEDAGEPIDNDEAEWFDGKDYACVDCQTCYWSDSVFPDEAIGWSYQADGYKLCDCLDNDIFVLESPYYTYCQFCSPCVPGAGNLDTPCEQGVKTFALGPEWFDADNPMPYRCWKMFTDEEVFMDK